MDWFFWAVMGFCLLTVGLDILLFRYLRKREATRRAILDLLRPRLAEDLGRRKARRLCRSMANLLDGLPEEELRDLLLSCGGLDGPALLDRIDRAIREGYAPLADFTGFR